MNGEFVTYQRDTHLQYNNNLNVPIITGTIFPAPHKCDRVCVIGVRIGYVQRDKFVTTRTIFRDTEYKEE